MSNNPWRDEAWVYEKDAAGAYLRIPSPAQIAKLASLRTRGVVDSAQVRILLRAMWPRTAQF